MKSNELPLPDAVANAERSMELARIWLVDGSQVVALSPNLWGEPANWGLMLVDLARHLSKQYAEAGWNETEVLERIKGAFDAEWSVQTSDIEKRS